MIFPWLKYVAGAFAIFALVAAVVWIRNDGAEGERQQIERQNNEAGNAADDARMSLRQCLDAGGLYQFDTGKCARPSRDGGQ